MDIKLRENGMTKAVTGSQKKRQGRDALGISRGSRQRATRRLEGSQYLISVPSETMTRKAAISLAGILGTTRRGSLETQAVSAPQYLRYQILMVIGSDLVLPR